jgi:hypothetical protein
MDLKATTLRFQCCQGTHQDALRIVTVPQRQAAQNRHVQCVEMLLEHVDDVIFSINFEARELTKRNPDQPRQVPGSSKHGQLPINLSDAHVHRFKQQDRAPQGRERPTCGCRDGVEIAAQKALTRHARPRNGGSEFLRSGDDDYVIPTHHGIAERVFVCRSIKSKDRAMHSCYPGVPVDGQVQVRDVTEPD